jgi:hypothetical protein
VGYTRGQWIVAVSGAVGLLIVLLALVVVALRATSPTQPGNRPFDRVSWLRHRGPLNPVRGQMSLDLIRNHLRAGMTRAQVRALLGAPDVLGDSDTYTIGAAPGFLGGEIDLRFRRGRLIDASRSECCAPGAAGTVA